jgi:PPP family 3-phenylpropionic acid transporter
MTPSQANARPIVGCTADDTSEDPEESIASPAWQGLVLFKTLYFLDGLGGSAWGRFGVIFYNRIKHLSEPQIGLLQGIRPILGFVARPLWGWIADALLQSRKTVFVVCKLAATACLMTLIIPANDSLQTVAFSVAGMSLFPTVGVLDAHALDFLGDANRGMYGSIRLWATISWGVGSVVMGFLTDYFGTFFWNFVVFGTMMILTVLFTLICLPARSKSELERYAKKDEDRSHEWIVLWRALYQWQILVWLTHVTLMGAAMSLVDSFLFVFLQKDLGATTSLCGFTVGVTVLLEIPVFANSKMLLSKLGHDGLFVVSMLAYATRVIGYTLLTPDTVHRVLWLEILHGITYATAWIAAIDFAAQFAPKEWPTLIQSLLSAFWGCLGGSLGPIFGGIVYNSYGAIAMFRGAGSIVGVTMILHLLLWQCGCFGHGDFLRQCNQVRSQAPEDDESLALVEMTTPKNRGNDEAGVSP